MVVGRFDEVIVVNDSDFNSPSFQISPEHLLHFAFEKIPNITVSDAQSTNLPKGVSIIFVSPKQGF